jgi:hypothetical protein
MDCPIRRTALERRASAPYSDSIDNPTGVHAMNPTTNRFWAILEEISDAFVKAALYVRDLVAGMSWAQLAVASVAVAIMLTIVPLALTVFLVLLIAKLAIGAVVVRVRRGKATAYKPVDEQGE